MKYILILIFLLPSLGYGQIHIQGEGVIPFTNIASSSYLTNANQISIDDALSKLVEFKVKNHFTNVNEAVGEYFFSNRFVINIVSRELSTMYAKKYQGIYKTYLYLKNLKIDKTIFKNKDNYNLLIYYFDGDNEIYFIIENNKYSIMGTLVCKSDQISEAKCFITNFTNSIIFK